MYKMFKSWLLSTWPHGLMATWPHGGHGKFHHLAFGSHLAFFFSYDFQVFNLA